MNNPSLKDRVSPEEWSVRVDLAACYRLVALYGWSDLTATHISARLPAESDDHQHQFLINPYGLLFEEITASSLIKIDVNGNKLSESEFGVNRAGFVIHSAIHSGRSDAMCVLHTHTRAGIAISALRSGLLPISQQSTFVLNSLGYHDYEGLAVYEEEQVRLQHDLASNNHLILRNHGLLTVGRTIAESFKRMYSLETACQIQLSAQSSGELIEIPSGIVRGVDKALDEMKVQEGLANLAWPALKRRLDRLNPGYDI